MPVNWDHSIPTSRTACLLRLGFAEAVSIPIVKADGSIVWEGKALSEAAPLIKASALRLRHIQLVGSKLPTVRVVIR